MTALLEILSLSPVVPVLSIADAEDAIPIARALSEGGIRVIEVTLRTAAEASPVPVKVGRRSLDGVLGVVGLCTATAGGVLSVW